MSAQFFMSDFELNIKNSFMEFFPKQKSKVVCSILQKQWLVKFINVDLNKISVT